jgi:predicted dehydrogenase
MKIALIGCGNNGRGHLNILKNIEGVEVVAIVDPRIEDLKEAQVLNANLYQDHQKMFENEVLDAVFISSPHKFHYEQTMAAFENNCHVMLEKPMALNEKDCRKMEETAKKKGLIFQISFECRKSKLYMRVKEILDSGEIGELLSISYLHHRSTWMNDWYCTREFGGNSMGVIETCHYVDLMRFWSGQDVEWVFASSPKANLRTEYEYPDTTYCQLGFQGGLIANIEESHALSTDCFMETGKPYGTGDGEWLEPVYGHRFEYSIVGSKGALCVRMIAKQISVLEKNTSRPGKRPQLSLKRVEDYTKLTFNELVHEHVLLDQLFIKSVQNNEAPVFSPEDALKSHLAVFAIERSEESGEKVSI